ncbi:hypothetical protein [Methanococcoides sp. AM1]|uniref:hypothetical protein n=1 Tax=Methanococcoides sp. AM1 TaxID=1201011 RepID=UPI001083F4A2|nr:hypothetical protein [Methanococcoides sp. AM1]
MQKIPPILLIGTLSMLFAEVFSGASQAWFINGWGILLTFPLYLAHLLFFLGIALKTERTSLSQLYLFGVLFALYESWITKVLWVGYLDSDGPSMGTFLGLGIGEFPILGFFWHPIMSFIVPILIFEILTGKVLTTHELILERTRRKTAILALFLILVSTFIANGNQFDLTSANISLTGTLVIIAVLYKFTKDSDLTSLKLEGRSFKLLEGYLITLYVITFLYLLPERIPTTILPYTSIIVFYAIPVILILRSAKKKEKLEILGNCSYSSRNLIIFIPLLILAVNIACFVPAISLSVLSITYILLSAIGVVLFLWVIYNIRKHDHPESTIEH